jgi:DNA sulfur modification protein DndD
MRRTIAQQEQRIASQGSWFAERLDDLKTTRQQLEVEIEVQRRQAQESANGLLPFAVAPQMCAFVAERLYLEAEYERSRAAHQTLDHQVKRVSDTLRSQGFWDDVGLDLEDPIRHKLLAKITSALREGIQPYGLDPREVIHQVSEGDRQTLLGWIEQATTRVPQEFRQSINRLNGLESKLAQVDEELALVPEDEALQPLVQALHRFNQELGALLQTRDDLVEQAARVDYELEQMEHQRERLRQQIAEQSQHETRIQLVDRTQRVLKEFASDLRREKGRMLEEKLAVRFNDLCRKQDLVEAVQVDPETFAITLYRQGEAFARAQLSAGERQILAVATMWALREVSGVPMPVILDTPFGRLDSEHRLRMIHGYLPRASHQVILLITDAEVDGEIVSRLGPVISRVYDLTYDADRGGTIVQESSAAEVLVQEGVVVQ